MSSAVDVLYEYRCTRCYQTLHANVSQAGCQVPCKYCGADLSVPEPTPDRIERAKQVVTVAAATGDAPQPGADVAMSPAANPFSDAAGEATTPANPYAPPALLTDADVERELKRQLHVDPSDMRTLTTITSSRLKRFMGAIIDSILAGIALVMGWLTLALLMYAGVIDAHEFSGPYAKPSLMTTVNTVAVTYIFLVLLTLFQWNLIATAGQTLGKKAMKMRIVTDQGRLPGFFQGVILRNWVRVLLSMIPFFGFLDAVVIFGDTRRCIHDFIAGTYVVDCD